MNIRVDLNTPIKDGTEVVFRSPVDCSQITGLIVYYKENGNTISKEFAFADAHGNNVGDIDHLFAENVVVKVILDISTSMAFVQNADTNAYLEGRLDEKAEIDDSAVGADAWSSKNIVDRLCPAFEESGGAVRCEPLEGYPLEVVSTIPETQLDVSSLTLHRTGKNLFDFKATPYVVTYGSAGAQRVGFKFQLPAGTYTLHAEGTPTADYIYGGVYNATGEHRGSCNIVVHNTLETVTISVGDGDTFYIYNGNRALNIGDAVALFAKFNVQIEVGSTATPYEPYRGETISVDFKEITSHAGNICMYDWNTGIVCEGLDCEYYQHNIETGTFERIPDIDSYEVRTVRNIQAMSGVNYLCCEHGNVTVKGRKDPVALFENLTNAIIALGGNV